jgi:hypothetical protein
MDQGPPFAADPFLLHLWFFGPGSTQAFERFLFTGGNDGAQLSYGSGVGTGCPALSRYFFFSFLTIRSSFFCPGITSK